jgi:hypothetical protein
LKIIVDVLASLAIVVLQSGNAFLERISRVMLGYPFFDERRPMWRAIFEPVVVLLLDQSCGEVTRVEEPRAGKVFVD